MENEYKRHYSVLKEECIEILAEGSENKENVCYADLTFGAGGHTTALAEKVPSAKIWSVDQDPEAIKNGKELLTSKNLSERVQLLYMNFEEFPTYIDESLQEVIENNGGFHGFLLDLGVSSHQFDSFDRGFSFRGDGPLDMRMNFENDSQLTAKEILNNWSFEEIKEILQNYGEEKFSNRIAERIIEERDQKPFETTKDLENLVFHCYPKKMRFGKIHPATKTFQALRIAVNDELGVVERTLEKLYQSLAPGGRLLVISFHSLEDRIVKNVFRNLHRADKKASEITKKPIIPKNEEIITNSRSRSAKLRVIIKK